MKPGPLLLTPLRLGACLLAALLTGCTVAEPGASTPATSPTAFPQPPPTSAAPPPSSGWPSADLSRYPTARPLRPAPDVRPRGLVKPPPGRGLQRYRHQRLSWRACPKAPGQCGTVRAPLDYRRPDGPAVTLAVRRIPPTERPRLGTLFVNPGGPGGSGWDFAGDIGKDGLGQFDVLGWDPRGVGRSTPVRCDLRAMARYIDADGTPDGPGELQRLLDLARTAGASCLARSGPLLAHVSTEETVRDLDLLRDLVGERTLTYYGQSYGTAIGSLYATMFPARVGRMVLDSAFTLDDDDLWSATYGFERQLHAFAADCVALPPCPLGGSEEEVMRRIGQLLTDLDTAPLPVGDRPLTQTQAVQAVRGELYRPQPGWYQLRVALHSAIEMRLGASLQVLADENLQRAPDGSLPPWVSAHPAVRCLDSPDVSVPARLGVARQEAERSPVLGPHLGLDVACTQWPAAPRRHPRVGGRVPSLLVIGTTGDSVTPYEKAVATSRRFPGSVLLTLEGHGHVAYWQSPCIQEHVVAYLVRGILPDAAASCTR